MMGLVALGVAIALVLGPRAGPLLIPVLIYIPIIVGMGLAALTLPHTGAVAWLLPAALAFIVSDIILAIEKFRLAADHAARRVTPWMIWGLYWGAQAGFVLTLAGGSA